MSTKGYLALEDGKIFGGRVFGYPADVFGELVFNTSMTGYQEILTDPSYKGQIVLMTYPHIGNYGINIGDVESDRIQVNGFVVKENAKLYSNHLAIKSLEEYMIENHITGIEGLDTRAVTKHIRQKGAMRSMIALNDGRSRDEIIETVRNSPSIQGINLVKEVSTKSICRYDNKLIPIESDADYTTDLVVVDCGTKYNILRLLSEYFKNIIVVPYNYGFTDILKFNPKGIFISNGPGDPSAVTETIENLRHLIDTEVPIFGICLGIQLLSLSFGAKTYKMKFGHRGANQPVKNLETGNVEITAQNHGFAVSQESLDGLDIEITHINLNDNSIEGIKHRNKNIFAVQYHPESSPGPHDSRYLFEKFKELTDDVWSKS